eukprot:8861997-Pyramimonas_sp.AAC.1
MWPWNGVLVSPRILPGTAQTLLGSPGGSPDSPRHPPRHPWGVKMLSFEPTRNLSVFAVR